MEWISVKERLPENLEEVIITWVNHCPASYYDSIKDVPMTGVAVFHRDKWYWYTPTTRDMLAEYGRFTQAEIDEDIEVVAWMPLPEPYDEETNFPTSAKWEEVVKSVFIELINDAMDGKYKNYTQPALIQECYEKAILAITNSGISYEKGEESTK